MSDDTREQSRRTPRDASAPPNHPDGTQFMRQPDGHLDAEMVSAWLDAPEDFTDDEQRAIQAHLASCDACAQIVAELTAIVRAFHSLPLEDAPRSFALTPEMAGLTATPTLPASQQPAEPVVLRDRSTQRPAAGTGMTLTPWMEQQMRTLRWATTIAAMLFVFFISIDVLGNIGTGGGDDDSMMIAMDAPASTSGDDAMGGSAEATEPALESASGLAEPEPTTAAADADDDTARSSDDTAIAEEDAESAAPESDDSDGSAESADTMMTTETAQEDDAGDTAIQQEATTEPYGGDAILSSDDNQESNTLHLIELALAAIIFWLLLAMVAVPRFGRRE